MSAARPAGARARAAPADPSLYDVEAREPACARRGHRVRSGGGHGRGPGRGRAGRVAPDVDRRRAPLLPLRHRRARSAASGPSSPPTTRCTRRRWNDVAIRIFHHPRHTAHLDRMMRSVRGLAGLLHRAVRSLSVPSSHRRRASRRARHGHARRRQHDHSRGGLPLLDPEGRTASLDLPVRGRGARDGAPVGRCPTRSSRALPFMTESLAWYSAMQVVKKSRGDEQLRRLLSFMRQPYPYPPIRRGEPLLRGARSVPRLPQGTLRAVRAERVRRRGAGERGAAAPAREARRGRRSAGDHARPVSRAAGGHAGLAASTCCTTCSR